MTKIAHPHRLACLLLAVAAAGCANVATNPLTQPAQTHLAQAALEAGDTAAAESLFAAAANAAQWDAAKQLQYADVLVRRGKIKQARELLTSRMGTVTDKAQLGDGLGAIDVLSGAPSQAIVEFDQQLLQNKDDARALVNKAVSLDLLGRHREAQALYRQVLSATPDDAVVLNDLALSMLLAGDTEGAAAVASDLNGRNDLIPRVRNTLSVVFAARGDLEAVRELSGAEGEKQVLQLANAAKNARLKSAGAN